MSSFRPPLRIKRKVENDENSLTDELCCSEGHASTQNSQEVLSCGFLPPKQRKRAPFQPPLRDLVSPGQGYINRILHEEESRHKEDVSSSCLASNFELAPLSHNNSNQSISDDSNMLKNVMPKKHHYYYHVGNRKIEQPGKTTDHKKATTVNMPTASTICIDGNDESRYKIFEFQLSQATKKDNNPKYETSKPLVQVIHICTCAMCPLLITPASHKYGHLPSY